jgi:hypothetical protein
MEVFGGVLKGLNQLGMDGVFEGVLKRSRKE